MHRLTIVTCVLGGLLGAGCAEPTPAPSGAATDAAPAATSASAPPVTAAPAAAPSPAPPTGAAVSDPASATATPAPPVTAPQPTASPQLVPAEAGVGVQGRSLDKYDSGVQSAIAEPARAYFAAKERVVFEILIPKAMQLYKATQGQAPATQEEFMREIIDANQIALPQLPPGQRYVYRPEAEELFVERPAP